MKNYFKNNYQLLILLFLAFLLRFLLIKDGVIPFQFDHGKDSLAVMDMWLNRHPKLIGPWTSIPGLYFGPAWYYLILPAFLIGSWHPLAPVFMMVLLLLIQIYLAWKYLGKIEAIMIAFAPTWLMISTSAWNPFPMTLISLLILILLKKIKEKKQANDWQLAGIAFLASLGCHFSTAFAVLFPLLIAINFWQLKVKLNFRRILILFFAYLIPFVPQILFELTHNFIETKAVLAYLAGGENQSTDLSKLNLILNHFFSQWKTSAFPDFYYPQLQKINQIVFFFFCTVSSFFMVKSLKKKRKIFSLSKIYLTWLLIPLVAYYFLHFNVWYILALAPLLVILSADLLRLWPKNLQLFFLSLFFISGFMKIIFFKNNDQLNLIAYSNFLPAKTEAISIIREDAAGKTFNSYHYAPDIYDFSYQYLYFWQALDGETLPADFSYKPKEMIYIVQKAALLEKFADQYPKQGSSLNYFIVEPAEFDQLLSSWWDQFSVRPEELIELPTNSNLKIYRQQIETKP